MSARVALGFAAVLALGATARADDRARAEQFYRAGQAAYAAQSFAAAAADFDEAYRALPLPELAFSAAQAYRRQYHIDPKPEYVERAVTLYRVYLDKVKSGGRVADASDSLAEMQRELEVLIKRGVKFSAELTAEHTQLDIMVSLGNPTHSTGAMREVDDKQPAPAEQVRVALDGAAVEPFTQINVTPGSHRVHVEAPGYLAIDQDAVAVQGNSIPVDIVLQPKPGHITVTTERGSRVEIDGHVVAEVTGGIEVLAGHHVVAVARRGRELGVRELDLANDERVRVDVPLARSTRRKAVPWVVGGAATLALASVGTTIAALVEEGDAESIRAKLGVPGNLTTTQRDAYNTAAQRRDDFRAVAFASGGAALVVLAVAGGLYWFDQPEIKAARLVPVPVGDAGIGVRARF